ncbi:MAG: hypothetical protein ACI93H_001841, partial [Psychromonas sp.]
MPSCVKHHRNGASQQLLIKKEETPEKFRTLS